MGRLLLICSCTSVQKKPFWSLKATEELNAEMGECGKFPCSDECYSTKAAHPNSRTQRPCVTFATLLHIEFAQYVYQKSI